MEVEPRSSLPGATSEWGVARPRRVASQPSSASPRDAKKKKKKKGKVESVGVQSWVGSGSGKSQTQFPFFNLLFIIVIVIVILFYFAGQQPKLTADLVRIRRSDPGQRGWIGSIDPG